jgi:hypothetical protein
MFVNPFFNRERLKSYPDSDRRDKNILEIPDDDKL